MKLQRIEFLKTIIFIYTYLYTHVLSLSLVNVLQQPDFGGELDLNIDMAKKIPVSKETFCLNYVFFSFLKCYFTIKMVYKV